MGVLVHAAWCTEGMQQVRQGRASTVGCMNTWVRDSNTHTYRAVQYSLVATATSSS
jgi:hypothetical protein